MTDIKPKEKRRINKDDSGSPDVGKERRKSLTMVDLDDKPKITDDAKPKREESKKDFDKKRDRAKSMDVAQLKAVQEANEMLRKKEESDKRKSDRREKEDKPRERKPFEKSRSMALDSPKNSPKTRSHRDLKATQENRIRNNSEDREDIRKKLTREDSKKDNRKDDKLEDKKDHHKLEDSKKKRRKGKITEIRKSKK